MRQTPPSSCPCGSGRAYDACCGVWLDGPAVPVTAEQLMRSRYCAYVLNRADYLGATWHATTRPAPAELAADPDCRWLGLAVKRHVDGGGGSAIVEFIARYQINGRAYRLHETSRFVHEQGRWWYVDGDIHPR